MTKVRAKDIVRRITGVPTPIGGIQWEPPEDERKITRAFVTFLEDRRVLFNPFHLEIEHQVIDSLIKIRETATGTLRELPEGSKAVGPIKAIRAACRRFLDEPHVDFHHLQRRWHRGYPGEGLCMTVRPAELWCAGSRRDNRTKHEYEPSEGPSWPIFLAP